jgi:hypothetical protein
VAPTPHLHLRGTRQDDVELGPLGPALEDGLTWLEALPLPDPSDPVEVLRCELREELDLAKGFDLGGQFVHLASPRLDAVRSDGAEVARL